MSDSYQAVYDATRSRISGCDVSGVIESVVRDAFSSISHYAQQAGYEAVMAQQELQRPFVTLKPKMFPDGNMWCALYGENLQEGVAAFGETPAKAATQFDIEWLNQKAKKDNAEPSEIFPNTYAALDNLKIR